MNKIIDGKEISKKIKDKLKKEIELIDSVLKLVVIQVGDAPASNVYIKNKRSLCEEMNILFEHKKYDYIEEEQLINEIEILNRDDSVNGILVQFPLPDYLNKDNIVNKISPKKDVDGLNSENMGKLFSGLDSLVPCTAFGIMELLKYQSIDLKGKDVVILGRSKLVGIPLCALLLRENATVTICHSNTINLKEITNKADILIVAIGRKEFITDEFIKEDAIIIDVGINRYDSKLYGDCNFDLVYDKCKAITPVPGGVGPLTVVMLVNNIIKAYYLQKNK